MSADQLTIPSPARDQPSTPKVGARKTAVDDLMRLVKSRLSERRPRWGTYRLQFTGAQFRFSDAARIADYLAELGISHIYSSPPLKTRRGSTHGYDVVDHASLNPELGGDDDFAALAESLAAHGLSQLIDIVPNHMSVASDENAWWLDVLANGPASRYAPYFDIDWHPVKRELENKVLLPVLDDFYGNVLEAGRLRVEYRDGALFVNCNESLLPLDVKSWSRVIAPSIDVSSSRNDGDEDAETLELQSILTAIQHLPERFETAPERVAERHRETLVIQGRLKSLVERSPRLAQHLAHRVEAINGTVGTPSTFDELDRLLSEQAYQLSHWKAGSDEMNYRRFFDVTELAALCMERLDVFETTHRVLFELAAHGRVDGFRVDHIDGLFDPEQYLWRLQWGYLRTLGRHLYQQLERNTDEWEWADIEEAFLESLQAEIGGPNPLRLLCRRDDNLSISADETCDKPFRGPLPLFVLVEKILGADEPLPTEWPVRGTTGYDFASLVNGMFVSGSGLHELERSYFRFIDERRDFRETVYESKRLILDGPMQSELQLLASRLDRLSHRHRKSRDYTLQALRAALREIIACFPVYRSYIHQGRFTDRDRRVVASAVAQARRRNPSMDVTVFEFIRNVLLLEQPPDLDDAGRVEREFFIGRFQQVTSPVMAKGVEDTAFYRDFPLASTNEVGADPVHAVKSVAEFHRQNELRAYEWPQTMLASTTHDTKRSEDVRARINVLSEIAGPWRSAVQRWSRWNRKYRREIDGESAPTRNDEWLFYQSLVGVWPLSPVTSEMRAELTERLRLYMEKATHEAKLQTSWISPNHAYDDAVREFVNKVLDQKNKRFLDDFQAFHDSIVESGLYTALSQQLLKLLSPGIPDIYQGQELWDFSLVDPDNRRPVDFERRRWLLAEIRTQTATPDAALNFCKQLAANPRDDRIKQLVTWAALKFRQEWPELTEYSEYVPFETTGTRAEHVCGFAWRAKEGSRAAVVVVPRLIFSLTKANSVRAPLGAELWQDTMVGAKQLEPQSFRNRFTQQLVTLKGGAFEVSSVLEHFPVALLTSQ